MGSEVEKQPKETSAKPAVKTKESYKNMGLVAMILGIVALVFGWVPILSLALGVTAIILGAISVKHLDSKGMSIAGIVMGALSSLWNIFVTIFWVVGLMGLAAVSGGLFNAANEITDSTNDYYSNQQSIVDAKKDYSKGETATFENVTVKVNSVTRNYTPSDDYYYLEEGKEYVVVNITVKNIGEDTEYFTSSSLMINDNGISDYASYVTVDDEFEGGNISPNASDTGNIVYEVDKGSTNLKLQYETSAYDSEKGEYVDLVYTLEI